MTDDDVKIEEIELDFTHMTSLSDGGVIDGVFYVGDEFKRELEARRWNLESYTVKIRDED